MLDSISNIFSLPTVARNRYKDQPSLRSYLKHNTLPSHPKKQPHRDNHLDNLIQCLQSPIEDWVLQHEQHLKSTTVNKKIFQLVIQNAQRGKLPVDQQSKITVHNLFVLMVQYDVLAEFVKQMQMGDLQLLIDGACGIILKNPMDSMEELTCVLHHIFTKSQMKKKQKGVEEIRCIQKSLEVENIPNFIKLYSQLPKRLNLGFYDSVVRVIPMLAQFFKLISLTNQGDSKHLILDKIKWVQDIPSQLLYTICTDIDEIIQYQSSKISFEGIPCESDDNPDLKRRLIEQAKKTLENGGSQTAENLFIFATRQLYYFQHILRLQKFMMRLAKGEQKHAQKHQRLALSFIQKYLKASLFYQVSLPLNNFKCLLEMMKQMRFQTRQQMQQLLPEMQNQHFKNKIKNIQECDKYQWRNVDTVNPSTSEPLFQLSDEQNIMCYIVTMIQNLNLNFMGLLALLFKKINRNFVQVLQNYLIGNGLLHFMIEEQEALQGQQKDNIQLYFTIVAQLVRENTFAHCILDDILRKTVKNNEKCRFQDAIRKYFYSAKPFLLVVLSDTIRVNTRNEDIGYFLPFSLQLLLYPEERSKPKHDIWISYIHDVIVRDLKKSNERLEIARHRDLRIDLDINQWITLAIMIQVQYVMLRRGKDLQLGQFTMNYMTNILKEAIKWQYEDETSVMKRILSNYEQWEEYYTDAILNSQTNEDVVETKLGPSVNFLFLKRWNKKITFSINIFIESVLTTQVSEMSIDQIKKLR